MKIAYAVAAAILVSAYCAFAAEEPACSGEVWVIRKSRIVEGGSVAGFMEAVEAQMAWYRANGVADNETAVGPVFDDGAGATQSPIEDMIMTVHMNSPGARADSLPYGDEAWNAFVELFRANSEIVEETRFCKSP